MQTKNVVIAALVVLLVVAGLSIGLAKGPREPQESRYQLVPDAKGGVWVLDGSGNVLFKNRPVEAGR